MPLASIDIWPIPSLKYTTLNNGSAWCKVRKHNCPTSYNSLNNGSHWNICALISLLWGIVTCSFCLTCIPSPKCPFVPNPINCFQTPDWMQMAALGASYPPVLPHIVPSQQCIDVCFLLNMAFEVRELCLQPCELPTSHWAYSIAMKCIYLNVEIFPFQFLFGLKLSLESPRELS